MTATTTPGTTTAPCSGDCIHIDGACRCRHGQTVPTTFGNRLLDNLNPPF